MISKIGGKKIFSSQLSVKQDPFEWNGKANQFTQTR